MIKDDSIREVTGCIYDSKGRKIEYTIKDIDPYYTTELYSIKLPNDPIVCTNGFYQVDGYEYIIIGANNELAKRFMEQHTLFNGVTDYEDGLAFTLNFEDRTQIRYTVIDIGKRFDKQIISKLYVGNISNKVKGFRQIIIEGYLHYVKELFDE